MHNAAAFKQALDLCPKSILMTDAQGTIIFANQQMCRMVGYQTEELLGKNPSLFKSGLTPKEVYESLWATISAGEVWSGELQNRNKAGELYWEALAIAPIRTAGGRISHYLAIKDDISLRKHLEFELRQMASVVQNSHDFIGLCTPEMVPFFLNDAGYRMVGLEPGEPFPPTILEVFWPEDLPLILETAIPTLKREGRWSGEVRFRHAKTGEPIYTRWDSFVIHDEQGEPVAWATNSPNLTYLKQIEQDLRLANESLERTIMAQADQLRFSEQKLSTAFGLAPDAVIVTRLKDGMCIEVNDGFCNLTGFIPVEVIGRTALGLNLWAHPADRERLLGAMQQSDQVTDFEAQFRRKDGSVLSGLLYARRIEVDGEPCIMSFTRDISELKRNEEALVRSSRLYETLYAANQAIIRATSQGELFGELCRTIVEHGGFLFAWIGLEQRETGLIQPVASFGDQYGYLDGIQVSSRLCETGAGPTGTAVREGVTVVCNDFMQHQGTSGWQARAQRSNIRSSAAFPLMVFGRPIGSLSVYSQVSNYFCRDYLALFEQLAADLSYALEHMEREQQRLQTEQRLVAVKEKQAQMATELSLLDQQVRLRISSELHDQIGQSLVLSRIKLGSLEQTLAAPSAKGAVADVRGLLEQVIAEVRSLTLQLTPPILASAGLESALGWLCRQIGDDYGLQIDFEDDGENKPLSEVLRSVIYQASRELLINCAKHAGASAVKLGVYRSGNRLVVQVHDDGQGFDPALAFNVHKDGCFGLFNVVRQVRHLGGQVEIHSLPANGSLITLTAPLLENEAAAPAEGN